MRGGKNGVREDFFHDLMVSEISVRHGGLGRTETFTSRWPGGTWGGQTSWLSEESVGHAILTLSSGPQSPHKAGCSPQGGSVTPGGLCGERAAASQAYTGGR